MTHAARGVVSTETAAPGVGTRLVVVAFLVLVFGSAAFEVEVWPLSAFKLFSQARTATEVRWELVAVDEAGTETPADLDAMGRPFRQAAHLLPGLAVASASARHSACAGWLAAERGVTAFRV